MKALFLKEKNHLSFENIPKPIKRNGERVLKVSFCSICRADSKMWKNGHRDLVLPRVLGHEISGICEETGERFVVWPGLSCGTCPQCLSGSENLCKEMKITGFHRDGGFAEFVSAPEKSLVPVPDSLPLEIASLAELMACGINAFEQLPEPDKISKALIVGGGSAGLMTAFAFASHGIDAKVLEKNPEKIQKSKDFTDKSGIEIEKDFEDSFDAAVNAASSPKALSDAIIKVSSGGSVVFFSGLSENIPVKTFNEIHYKQLNVYGAYGCKKNQMEQAVKLLDQNSEAFKFLIERRVKLEDVPDIMPLVESGKHLKFTIEF
jgi:threonine dehydrogenase-like Zn-dependent dehydrogenase